MTVDEENHVSVDKYSFENTVKCIIENWRFSTTGKHRDMGKKFVPKLIAVLCQKVQQSLSVGSHFCKKPSAIFETDEIILSVHFLHQKSYLSWWFP